MIEVPIVNISYCKCGYFRGGGGGGLCHQDLTHGCNFHDSDKICLHTCVMVKILCGEIFVMNAKSRRNTKFTPTRKFPRLQ